MEGRVHKPGGREAAFTQAKGLNRTFWSLRDGQLGQLPAPPQFTQICRKALELKLLRFGSEVENIL